MPDAWPTDLSTKINAAHPLSVTRPGLSVYAASSPPPFCPLGREEDADAIVKIIDAASVFVRVAVMDYFPATIYSGNRTKFWPTIDNALRRGECLGFTRSGPGGLTWRARGLHAVSITKNSVLNKLRILLHVCSLFLTQF